MVNVLILTESKDAHARLVSETLKKKGASPHRWFTNEYLLNQTSNLYISSSGNINSSVNMPFKIDMSEIDVVWFRRPEPPRLPKNLHSDDKKFVNAENRMHLRTLWLMLADSAVWVNPLHSYDKSNCKGYQLREAINIGMSIPETLISNDKDAIIDFIDKNRHTDVIYKTFSPSFWEEGEDVFCFHTSAVSSNNLPEQTILRLTPGIYQTRIQKAFEVRVTFFGDYYLAVKIHNSTELDWRPHSVFEKIRLSLTKLPHEVERQCLTLMKKLGIIFGCFDFIVTPSGDFVFLEINEMGQFLWIEERLPNLKFLDSFCEFLLSCTDNSFRNENINSVSLDDISNSSTYKMSLKEDIRRHSFLNEECEVSN